MSAINDAIHDRLAKELSVSRIVGSVLAEFLIMVKENPTGPEFAQCYVDRYGRTGALSALDIFSRDSEALIAAIAYWRHCVACEVNGRLNAPIKPISGPRNG